MEQTVSAGKLNWGKRACAIFALCATAAIALPAQTFTTLRSLFGTDGAYPSAGLVQAIDGNLYGTTYGGGANCAPFGCGTVFKISTGGTLTTCYSFCSQSDCADGGGPQAALVQAANGDFYGTTLNSGATRGTVFKITPGGTLTTLYNFCSHTGCTDGAQPYAGLVEATNGDFYGTTPSGGANCVSDGGCGTVFKVTPSGTLTTLYSFCPQSGCTDGEYPEAGLVQGPNGDFYGTTQAGGANGWGTVFKITPNGTLTTLYSFCSQSGCRDGEYPYGGLVRAVSGNFYGTTANGGANDAGTIFKITPSGTLTTLHNFCSQSGCADGSDPQSALIQATDGNFYGTTLYGGNDASGTLFRITQSGAFTTLHSFCAQPGCPDGQYTYARLVQATNGDLYGTTSQGGANDLGTVFSLSVGLAPFVETKPTSGEVGAAIRILGSDLTGATSVTFNGTAAVFEVVAPTEISTTVPAGASTGTVQVITPSGTLSSNVSFQVLP
ncbi:MAG TPA: choice-of-anchor tandem repeat GloVer-containing protein [Bryobacteraceae bacterium]|jgi:uncharacterized repeat protein (TIGR03803 family)|nr:choice-of-anchor tandem repeat GloVer-containing protein [Bryobacteraceae bacterium]